MRRSRLRALLLLVPPAALGPQGCGGGDQDSSPSTAAAAGGGGDAGKAGKAGGAAKAGAAGKTGAAGNGGGCTPIPRASFIPESWTLHTYNCSCQFYSVGVDPPELPGPAWGPCDGVLKFETGVCEQDWTNTILGRPASPLGNPVLSGSMYVKETAGRWLAHMGWALDFDVKKLDQLSDLVIVRDTHGKVRNGLYFPSASLPCAGGFGSVSDGMMSAPLQSGTADGTVGVAVLRLDGSTPLFALDANIPLMQANIHHMKSG